MKLRLSENIRTFRRQHNMTQEQLAEALGVTAGAVYKWENGRSTPEVGLIADMAELFGVSMDALMGYEMRSSDKEQIVERLREYVHDRDATYAAEEAERVLKRYPNTFEIVHQCARLFEVKGIDEHNEGYARRALELYRRALLLIGQNMDESISALTIRLRIADMYVQLDEVEKAVELLKKDNPNRINSARIGELLASFCNRPDEAFEYLSEGMTDYLMLMMALNNGYLNFFMKKKEYAAALDFLFWNLRSLEGLKLPGQTSFLDKSCAINLLLCSEFYLFMNQKERAGEYMRRAIEAAREFDADPSYACSRIRFISTESKATIHDSMGATAMEALQKHVDEENDTDFTALWEEIIHEEG